LSSSSTSLQLQLHVQQPGLHLQQSKQQQILHLQQGGSTSI